MSNTLSVRLTRRKTSTGDMYEGTVAIANVRPTKLVRKADGTTHFPTRSAVCASARNVAKSLGYSDVNIVDASQPAQTVAKKAAAKKSSVSATTTSTAATQASQTTATVASKRPTQNTQRPR